MSKSLSALVVAVGLAVCCPRGAGRLAAQESDTALPTKKIVMFNSGVAYFERRGDVTGDSQVELKFNVDDVNDLLKSMVLQDFGGGQVSSVNYGSKDPITRTLKTFAIDLTNNPTMADLLDQVRGEKIQIDAPNPMVGTIIGVETRKEVVGDEVNSVQHLNLLTDDGLRSVRLDRVGHIKLLNQRLDAELRKALVVLATGHSTDEKSVTLKFRGKGKRGVRVGYVQEAPIWKTSYRLALDSGPQAKPLLQGWAIVENTSEEDWTQVDLTLVSGRPISFVMDLYQPLYVNRPVVEPELFASLRPQTYNQDLADRAALFRERAQTAPSAEKAEKAKEAQNANNARREAGGLAGGFARAPRSKQASPRWNLQQGVQSAAQAAEVGELFQYVIDTPVTLPRRQSAMLPIVNGAVEAKKVSIYNPAVQAKHPLNGLKLTNNTGLHLMQGPITVFDGNVYAGDAQIQDLQPGAQRLISYALDLDTEVAPELKNPTEELVQCTLVKGVLHAERKYRRRRDYTVKNSGDKAKTVLIEYPVDPSWKLTEPQKPAEKTRDLYRFALEAAPGKPTSVTVVEERTAEQQIALTNANDNTIAIYIRSPNVSDSVKAALQEVIRRKSELAELAANRQRLEQQIKVIGQEQARIRQNMAQLPRDGDLYNRYVRKFADQEDDIERLQQQILAAKDVEAAKRKSLDEYLGNLTIKI